MQNADSNSADKLPDPDELPFVAPSNKLDTWDSLNWLKLGWRDFRTATRVSVTYGSILFLISWSLAILSWKLGGAVLLFSLLSGLVFIAPVLALGLYSVSCQIASGNKPKLAYCIREGKRHLGNEMVFSVVLLIVFLVWARAGSGLHVFFPVESGAPVSEYLTFYMVGSAVGSIFAALVFCASAFSLPMMMDRKADAITAVITSINAVRKNKLPMFIWAIIIGTSIVLCVVTGFLAMIVVMPVVGYATWHGYKQTIDAHLWQENRKLSEQYPNPGEEHPA